MSEGAKGAAGAAAIVLAAGAGTRMKSTLAAIFLFILQFNPLMVSI